MPTPQNITGPDTEVRMKVVYGKYVIFFNDFAFSS